MQTKRHMTEKFPINTTILLIASDPLMRSILGETLEHAGYLVVVADDIGTAVDRLKDVTPDLLVIRPFITSMPGHEAAHYLRSKCPGLPVLIVGGFPDDDRIRIHYSLENFHLFPRPFAPSELVVQVKEVLRVSRGTHPIAGN
jgi:DNA-binding response OmpR family regulator